MGITSRIKRPLDRTIPSLRDTKLIIIACEGEKTEKQYFSAPHFKHHKIQIKILESEDGNSSPRAVHRRLRNFAMETELGHGDQLWLVIDRDRWTDSMLSQICSEAVRGKLAANVALSNPSFELWLVLHLNELENKPISNVELIQKLQHLLGGYSKSNIKHEQFIEGINKAILRAEALDINKTHRWPQNPGTRVYILVKEIANIVNS